MHFVSSWKSIDFEEAKEAEPEVHDKACPGVEHALRYRWHSERMIRVDRIGGLQGLPSLAERVLSSGLLTGYRKYNRPRLSLPQRFASPIKNIFDSNFSYSCCQIRIWPKLINGVRLFF